VFGERYRSIRSRLGGRLAVFAGSTVDLRVGTVPPAGLYMPTLAIFFDLHVQNGLFIIFGLTFFAHWGD
jgi:hypothetical protein